MPKYRFVKEFEGLKVGLIYDSSNKILFDYDNHFSTNSCLLLDREIQLMLMAGVIEEVSERYEILSEHDEFYSVSISGNWICHTLADFQVEEDEWKKEEGENIWASGNVFETQKQAQEAARRVKATLLAYHEELNKK